MSVLARYLSRQIAGNTLAITLVALLLFTSTRFVRLVERLSGTEVISDILFILLLNMPGYLVEVFPLGLFLGILLALGNLYANSEMTAIFASGVPFNRIRNMMLAIGLLGAMVIWALDLFIVPSLEKTALAKQREITNRNPIELIQSGQFMVVDKASNTVIYAEESRGSSTPMREVFYANPEQGTYFWADSAQLVNTGEQRFFTLQNGLQAIHENNKQLQSLLQFEQYAFVINDPKPGFQRFQATTMTNRELLASKRIWELAEFLSRIGFAPLMIVLAMLALVLAKSDPRQGQFRMILPAIVLYSVYTLLLSSSIRPVFRGEASVWQVYWWVHVLFLAIAYGYYRLSNQRFKRAKQHD